MRSLFLLHQKDVRDLCVPNKGRRSLVATVGLHSPAEKVPCTLNLIEPMFSQGCSKEQVRVVRVTFDAFRKNLGKVGTWHVCDERASA